ncbi:MAG: glycerol-3-phosphate dehydrogenase [Flavobacteriia bacterium]|nr:MAG: glycerol-3-phosphate dehydrogenase [Flavobacteriia bacterium]
MRRLDKQNKQPEYDIVVIGGGISGASVAYEATARGLTVALVEKDDFAHATSSATSKMIHGGLRYLQKMEISIVRESLRERRVLANIAPNLVFPLPFLLNSYSHDSIPYVAFKMGMILYDLLSYDKNRLWQDAKKITGHKSYTPEQLLQMEPYIKKEGLKKGLMYYDYANIVPERLTLAFIKSAVAKGAQVANYAKVTGFLVTEGKQVQGVKVRDLHTHEDYDLQANLVINCAGPWADLVLHQSNLLEQPLHLMRSEGIHLIVDKKVNNHVISATIPGKGHCFMGPWRNHTMIGTTDKRYDGDPDAWHVTKESVLELLADANSVFGNDTPIKPSDIKYVYGGLRPLVESKDKDVYGTSRHYEIETYDHEKLTGLVTVAGGKFTTSRSLAEHVVDKAERLTGRPHQKSQTAEQYLEGSNIPDFEAFVKQKTVAYPDMKPEQVRFLCEYYGDKFEDLLSIAEDNPAYLEPLDADGEIGAQVIYAIRQEMALTLGDILFRRTGLGTLGHPGQDCLNKIAQWAAEELHWTKEELQHQIDEVEKQFKVPV